MIHRRARDSEPDPYQRAAALLRASQNVVALTGAGISTHSGIPDFRSEGSGLWTHVDSLDFATVWGFRQDPQRFYTWFRPVLRSALAARPNRAHLSLARLQTAGALRTIVTQNIDSLHQAAGSRDVLELHGHLRTATCLSCREVAPADALLRCVVAGAPVPPCAGCGGLLKPDVVLFGEPLPYETLSQAQHAALACDTMLVVGTSLEVMPAADLPLLARRRGARLILINLTATGLDDQMDVVIHADVVRALDRLCDRAGA